MLSIKRHAAGGSSRRSAHRHGVHSSHHHYSHGSFDLARLTGLSIFSLIVMVAPLAFGSVDRPWQITLTFLLAAGLLVVPVQFYPRRGWATALILGGAVWLLVKDFLPADWLGLPQWRVTAHDAFGIVFPGTHHPEPGRAVDGWLVLVVGIFWLQWVRTLAAEPVYRGWLVWSLLLSATAVALVSLFVRSDPALGIFGVRATPGWTGFGPFPNRNHTACLLGMGALAGLGLVVRSFRKVASWQTGIAGLCIFAVVIGGLESRSRGGLIAVAIGGIFFSMLMLIRRRDRNTVTAIAGGVLLLASLVLAFGGPVLERLGSEQQGTVSNMLRMAVWKDTFKMWMAEPYTGHGFGAFASVFPFFMEMKAYGVVVLHPESSWLLWLVEVGGIVAAISLVLLVRLMVLRIPELFREQQGFDLRAGALAAFIVLAVQSIWDVPAHRWGTAWFGLAALGIAFPVAPSEIVQPRRFPGVALVALIGLFWTVPFFILRPYFMPSTLERVQAKATSSPSRVPTVELERVLAWFPLSANLHHLIGLRYLVQPGWEQAAVQQFRAADQLKPALWSLPIAHAKVLGPRSTRAARHFWTLAIERGGPRAEEFFNSAWEATSTKAGGVAFWRGYAEANPYLLLSYAQKVDPDKARAAFQEWWDNRASNRDLQPFEVAAFYRMVSRFGTEAQLREWMRIHPERRKAEYESWARIMATLGDVEGAWALLSEYTVEPPYPEQRIAPKKEALEAQWKRNPLDVLNAQSLAQVLERSNQRAESEAIILEIAGRENAPRWFRQKAGFILARQGRHREAVATYLPPN